MQYSKTSKLKQAADKSDHAKLLLGLAPVLNPVQPNPIGFYLAGRNKLLVKGGKGAKNATIYTQAKLD